MTSKKSSPKVGRRSQTNVQPMLGEQTFRLMFEGYSAVMLLIEPQTGIILDANQAAVSFYGYSKSKLCSMSINEINALPPEQVDVERQKASSEGRNYFVFPHKLANGEERIVEVYLSPIVLQEKQVLFSIIHDITGRKQAEEALNVEQYLLRALMNSVPVQIYFKDLGSRFIRINNAQAQLFRLNDPEQAIGKTDFDFFTEEHARQAFEDEQEIIRTGQPINKEEKETWNDLPNTWVSTTKLPLRDKGEKIIGTFGISVDVTKRKQAEEALDESKHLFHLLLESLPQNIYAKDVDGRFIFANQHYCVTQGKRLEEIVGKTDFDLHPPELAEKYLMDDRRVIETGKAIELIEEHQPIGEKKFFVQVIKTPFYDSKKQTAGTLGVFWDITERKQAEEALNESKLLFHLLIESLPQNIYAKDVDGRFIFANQQYCATQGRSLEEIVGKTDFELHPIELAEKYLKDDHRVIKTGETIELEEEHQPIGKKKFFVQVIKTPFYYSKGQPAGILGIFWDITERKQAEAELRRAQDALETAHRELQQSFAREQQLARTDAQTGINNRRSLFELAEREFNVATRYQSPLSVLIFDIDHFKQINDAFGHAVGDQVLERTTQVACAEIRSVDVIGRYGGDEFVVLLPKTNVQEALPLAERIRASIAAMRMETDRGLLTLTVSIGITQTIQNTEPESGRTIRDNAQSDTVENLFLRADQALYAAKQAGRNRTVIFEQK